MHPLPKFFFKQIFLPNFTSASCKPTAAGLFNLLVHQEFSTDTKKSGAAEYLDVSKYINPSNKFYRADEDLAKKIAKNDLSHLRSLEREFELKKGELGKTRILGLNDIEAVENFYKRLSSENMSLIKESYCMYRNRGQDAADFQTVQYLNYLTYCVVVGIQVNVNGKDELAGISYFIRPTQGETENQMCYPWGTVVGDDFQGQGVGTKLKAFQIQCAQQEGFNTMENSYLSDAMVKTWKAASELLGLPIKEVTITAWHGGKQTTHIIPLK